MFPSAYLFTPRNFIWILVWLDVALCFTSGRTTPALASVNNEKAPDISMASEINGDAMPASELQRCRGQKYTAENECSSGEKATMTSLSK